MEMCPSPPKNSLTEGPGHWTSTVRVRRESGGSTDCWGQHLVAYQYNVQEKFGQAPLTAAPHPNCLASTHIQPSLARPRHHTHPPRVHKDDQRRDQELQWGERQGGRNYIKTISLLKERRR